MSSKAEELNRVKAEISKLKGDTRAINNNGATSKRKVKKLEDIIRDIKNSDNNITRINRNIKDTDRELDDAVKISGVALGDDILRAVEKTSYSDSNISSAIESINREIAKEKQSQSDSKNKVNGINNKITTLKIKRDALIKEILAGQ